MFTPEIFQTQVENSVEKTLCCWLCTSGPISITSFTDRRGYCPGESHLQKSYLICFFSKL